MLTGGGGGGEWVAAGRKEGRGNEDRPEKNRGEGASNGKEGKATYKCLLLPDYLSSHCPLTAVLGEER